MMSDPERIRDANYSIYEDELNVFHGGATPKVERPLIIKWEAYLYLRGIAEVVPSSTESLFLMDALSGEVVIQHGKLLVPLRLSIEQDIVDRQDPTYDYRHGMVGWARGTYPHIPELVSAIELVQGVSPEPKDDGADLGVLTLLATSA